MHVQNKPAYDRSPFFLVVIVISSTEVCIRSSEKFLSFYKEIMDAQHFPFYIILSNSV